MLYTEIELINHIIKSRRSVKPQFYNKKRVDDEIIFNMLENARWAPTHGLTEPWQFFIFCDEGRKKLADFQSALYKKITAPELFNEAKYQKLIATPLSASHIILIGMKRQLIEKIPEWEEIAAIGCALQNMQLTAEAYEIGSYWSTGGMSQHDEMKNFLGLDAKDKCLGMLYVGNYEGEKPVSKRTNIKEKTVWINK